MNVKNPKARSRYVCGFSQVVIKQLRKKKVCILQKANHNYLFVFVCSIQTAISHSERDIVKET